MPESSFVGCTHGGDDRWLYPARYTALSTTDELTLQRDFYGTEAALTITLGQTTRMMCMSG